MSDQNKASDTTSIAIFSKAAVMLAEADTIQKAKELKSLALTAAEWAKRKNMGEEAIQHCRSYALEAERKMGQMLIEGKAAGEVAKQGRPKNLTAGKVIPTKCDDVGISWRESAEAQMLAALSEATRTRSLSFDAATGTLRAAKAIVVRRHTPPPAVTRVLNATQFRGTRRTVLCV